MYESQYTFCKWVDNKYIRKYHFLFMILIALNLVDGNLLVMDFVR